MPILANAVEVDPSDSLHFKNWQSVRTADRIEDSGYLPVSQYMKNQRYCPPVRPPKIIVTEMWVLHKIGKFAIIEVTKHTCNIVKG